MNPKNKRLRAPYYHGTRCLFMFCNTYNGKSLCVKY